MFNRLKHNLLLQDTLIIAVSIVLAVALVKTGVLADVLNTVTQYQILGPFVAGMFFTSVLTTAPAMAALGLLAQTHSLFLVAVVGAAGAVVGDWVLFCFIRNRFSDHLLEVAIHRHERRKGSVLRKLRALRWLSFLVGGLIIASPLPDELGISLLGFEKVKTSRFILISFVFNCIGIVLIGLAARAFF